MSAPTTGEFYYLKEEQHDGYKDVIRRDHVKEHQYVSVFVKWPLSAFYGLNSFQFFQGLHGFFRHTSDVFIGFLPWARRTSYINSSLTLTRYRGYNDDLV